MIENSYGYRFYSVGSSESTVDNGVYALRTNSDWLIDYLWIDEWVALFLLATITFLLWIKWLSSNTIQHVYSNFQKYIESKVYC